MPEGTEGTTPANEPAPSLGEFLDGQGATQVDPQDPPTDPGTPPAQPTADPPAAADDDDTPADLDGELTQDQFDRKYVEKLRKEAAGYRQRAKQFEEYFDGYDDQGREALLGLAKELRENPQSAAQRMSEAAKQILSQYEQAATQSDPDPGLDPDDEPQYLTKDEYQKLRQQEAVDHQKRLLATEAREIGYEDGVDRDLLYHFAANETNGDLKAAHEKVVAYHQAQVDRWLQGKAQDAENTPTPQSDRGVPASSEKPIKDFKDAKAALMDLIARGGA